MFVSSYYSNTVGEFNNTTNEEILNSLLQGSNALYNRETEESQIRAWKDELFVFRNYLSDLPPNWGIIFEYVLPRENGRRPDVIILSNKEIYVLEFKKADREHLSHIDQVLGYKNDLVNYQSFCRNKIVKAILVPTDSFDLHKNIAGVIVVSPDKIREVFTDDGDCSVAPIHEFLNAEYNPLPSILYAAKLFYEKEPLPRVKTAQSMKIDETIFYMQSKASLALKNHKNLLMLVTGVPGAGKTLVGIQFTFNNCNDGKQNAVMLSGNGPLVEVLRYVLKNSRSLVSDVHGFMQTYGGASDKKVKESIIIYDEAQRAWDRKRAQEQRGTDANNEPEDLMHVAKNKGDGLVIVGLIGEGQEINRGEEAGIGQWNEAIMNSGLQWEVCCPKHVSGFFENPEITEMLNLSSSIRSKAALELPKWVDAVLEGDKNKAYLLAKDIFDNYPVYITKSLRSAKNYLYQRYHKENSKRYGIVASAKAKNLSNYGIPNTFMSAKRLKVGPWYADDPESPLSCCQLTTCVTEFSSQGLELDFPLLAWGDDFIRKDGTWVNTAKSKNLIDPDRIRKNSYRVLLTRGREGMIIFIPDEEKMSETFDYLAGCGCRTGKESS